MTAAHDGRETGESAGSSPAGDLWVAAPASLRELAELAVELARTAAAVHLEGRRAGLRIETKSSPTDHVSQVDREAERVIVGRIARERPTDAVLAEEGSLRDGGSGVRWVIDPLDGTTNYIYGYPGHAVSIAVEVGGTARVGVVFDSATGHLYRAIDGFGAYCDDRPIRARRQPDLGAALVATGFSYDAAQRARQGAAVAHVLERVRDIRRGGSAALDLCHLAAGHVDAYWELDLSPWDHAAGCVIAREAGAEVLLRRGAHGRGPAVVGASPELLPSLLELLVDAGALV